MELGELKKELDELKMSLQHAGTEFIMGSKGMCIVACVNGCETGCSESRRDADTCDASRENGD